MKIIWLCNVMLPMISEALNEKPNNYGGWLTGAAMEMSTRDNISLYIIFPHNSIINDEVVNGIHFYSFLNTNFDNRFVSLIDTIDPDIIHIHGTEHNAFQRMTNIAEKYDILKRVVVSIQGMPCYYAKHYYCNLPISIINQYSVRDILKMENIRRAKIKMERTGEKERYYLSKVKNIIGRTDWDKGCTYLLNPKANYFHCNESLRPSFYDGQWEYQFCEKHSIFVSQSTYPIKGFHIMLEAFIDILKVYPDAKLYTTGNSPLKKRAKERIRMSSYEKYIGKLIRENKLEENVIFLGFLDEKQMKGRFLKSNVFVSCSSIENSPNSVGEAMILGVPVISSDVGGVKNMLIHNEDGLIYPYDEPYMLAFYVISLFDNVELSCKFSRNSRNQAHKTHDRKTNCDELIRIYSEIAE